MKAKPNHFTLKITTLCLTLSMVLDIFKLQGVSEAGFASYIRCKNGKRSYSVEPVI
jgi:hypothetical protein